MAGLAVPARAGPDDDDAPTLRLPGHAPLPLPPGTQVFGPGQGHSSPNRNRLRDGESVGESTGQEAGRDIGENDIPDRPNNDLYHEYGTVTPGGGNPLGRQGRAVGGGFGSTLPNGGNMVIGPGGIVPPRMESEPRRRAAAPPPPTPAQKQAQIRKALVPAPPFALARRDNLAKLYRRLTAAPDEADAKRVASAIIALWLQSGSDTTALLVSRADRALSAKQYGVALTVLDKVVALQPDWAEGWNKRATVRYLSGDLNGAMADVDHVLKLEPNHFAALNGLAMILQQTGFPKRALQVYRRELAIYPHQPELEQLVEKLSTEVEGQGI